MASVANAAYAETDAETPAKEEKEPEFKGKDIVAYKRMFQKSEEFCAEARKLAHRDRDWHDNYNDSQWSDEEKKILTKRRQPIVTSNRIKRKIGFLCGMEQRQRSDPKAFPRKPMDEKSAGVITDVLDFVETETRFDHTASQGFRELNIEGIEAAEVIVENGDVIEINLLAYDGFFYDPRSKKRDFSDARYLGYQDWFDDDEAIEMAVGMGLDEATARLVIAASYEAPGGDEGYDDKPGQMWGDEERKRVRIACMYWKDGKGVWNYVYFTGGGIIKEGVSVYLDYTNSPEGKPACAIIAASAYMTRKNERFGSVRDMISPQSEMNFRRSQALFFMKQKRLWQRAPGILPADASEVVARADAVLTANGVKDTEWGFVENQNEVADNFQLLQEAKGEIDAQGPNAGLQGRGTEDQSGRAIIAQQNAGMAEENDIFDTHNDWKLRIYRAMWFRVKQFWTSEKYIRITEDGEAPRFVGLNAPKPMMQMGPDGQPIPGPDGKPQPVIGESGKPVPEIDPMTGQPVIENPVGELDADIILQAAPDSITLQQEEFEQLTQMASSGVPIPPDILILASQIRDKEKLVKRMQEDGGKDAIIQKLGQQIEQLQQALQAMQKQVQQSQQEAQRAMMQKPLTPVDMVKMQTEQVKQQQIGAQTEHTKAQTAQIAKEIMTPPEGPEPLDPLDMADIAHKRAQTQQVGAQTVKTLAEAGASRAQTFKTVHETLHPPKPAPSKPVGNGGGSR